jgi:hypothetical protein
MQVGDLATWVSSAGTVGALIFTAYTLRRQIDRERRADDEQRRMHAKRVRVSITRGPTLIADVNNDGDANIYTVAVYLLERKTRELIARSDGQVDIVAPGTSKSFSLVPLIPGTEMPSSFYCFAQFTDDNGYRWSRYVMGLLSEVAHEKEINRKRAEALLVSLSRVGDPPSVVEVSNNGERTIHQVRILVTDKSDQHLIGVSETPQETIAPGGSCHFSIIPTGQASDAATDYFCIARFTDSYAIKWDRYLRGRLDKISPDPARDHSNGDNQILKRWISALGKRWRRIVSQAPPLDA